MMLTTPTTTRRRALAAALATGAVASALAVTTASSAEAAGYVQIRNVRSGLCVSADPAYPTETSVQLVQLACNSSDPKQRWSIQPYDGSRHLFNASTAACMDAHGPYRNGTPVDTWPCNWISNEKWGGTPLSRRNAVGTIRSNNGTCLKVEYGSTTPGARLEIESCNYANTAQQFVTVDV